MLKLLVKDLVIFMKFEARKMTVSDLDSIKNILQTDFDDFWNYNVFKSELENENSRYVVCLKDNEIVGFAGIWIAIDIAHITNIVVRKNCRGNGIGSFMLGKLILLCKQLSLKELTLEVNENNTSAIGLYEKFGFSRVGFRKKYYRNNDNALIMTLIIS